MGDAKISLIRVANYDGAHLKNKGEYASLWKHFRQTYGWTDARSCRNA